MQDKLKVLMPRPRDNSGYAEDLMQPMPLYNAVYCRNALVSR